MSFIEYEKAGKMGIKAYRTAVQKGKHPYLPVLDEIIQENDIVKEKNLGVIRVPLSRVVGTSTRSRTYAFANNFMPVLNGKTEFAYKWSALADAQMNEGIRDPIKVYEYLNYYYVIEGNKRVSVMKFFDAIEIPAEVIRKIPRRTDDKEIKIYYEFMDFNALTGINDIWVSEEGNFQKFIDKVLKSKAERASLMEQNGEDKKNSSSNILNNLTALAEDDVNKWTEYDSKNFMSVLYKFSEAYEQKGGKKLENITTGDAFLAFLDIYDFYEALDMSKDEMKRAVSNTWEEYLTKDKNEVLDINLTPPDDTKKSKSILGQILTSSSSANKPIKVAFVYDRDPMTSDFLYTHELGRNHLKEVFGDKISTLKVTTAKTEDDAVAAIDELVTKEKCEVIFTTTSQLVDASLKCAVKYPNVKILNCSLNTSHRYIRTYYARLYESKFLSGMIAGALTESNKLGYLADYPIYGMTANINAFAMGARMVNPRAVVYLKWTTLKEDDKKSELYREFYESGVDYISDQDMITPKHASRRFGMYKLSAEEPENIAMPVYNWGKMYEKIIRLIMNDSWDVADSGNAGVPVNYWWGLSAGVIDIILSNKLPDGVRRLVSAMKELMTDGSFTPFYGKIVSQNGEIRNEEGRLMPPEEIMTMDWLVENVEGIIPSIDSLKERARQIVELKGVLKDDENSSDS
ncbi:nucleoside-binding protein [Eubacterium ruminantium]|uniref:Nucleoside-binding protein n=1 Tax=Eubacterium ruminantium TaxID=42322 RepID=A0A1T4NFZ1_9FIRM|nr:MULTISPECIES: BMP family ABC transporter substrate-binding protein [Eubacterium]MCR5368898.1 BMP family ABC transporter substrate-binding protein [Eubacterium sp.]SCW53427.1 nucleoside-binding protein [Eubacterium ruminantium]SDM86859.1 nucleoside-binding protein [Eubacterium ruminantium]SJZ78033.1 nucleoside-binding protein [Eubacterium ruminantium]